MSYCLSKNTKEQLVNMKFENTIIKNNTYIATIVDLGINGEGIGKVDNLTVFIPDALINEEVEFIAVKVCKNFAYGKLTKIINSSPERISPKCEVFSKCGGCTLQHLDYSSQLDWKQNHVVSTLKRIGKLGELIDNENIVKPIVGMENPFRYRNKSLIPVSKGKNNEIEIGFFAKNSHRVVSTNDCVISHPITRELIEKTKEFMTKFNLTAYDEKNHSGLIRNLLLRTSHHYNEFMICLVINGNKLPNENEFIEIFKTIDNIAGISISVNKKQTNVPLGDKIINIWGNPYIRDKISDMDYEISPKSFFQINPVQTELLYNKAIELANLSIDSILIDCYCGIGTMTIAGAKHCREVYGIEVVSDAIKNAKNNAKQNNIDNISFYCGEVEVELKNVYDTIIQKDSVTIILDPPRKGLEKVVIDTLIELSPLKIVYVSCNPSTLARDLSCLCENVYELKEVQAFDCFPMTSHVETVILLHRKDIVI